MGEPTLVVIGALIESRGGQRRLLISRRRCDAVLGGMWELPGGKLRDGESLADCLVREFKEELGVTVHVDESLGTVDHEYEHGSVRLHAFTCQRTDGEPVDREVAEHRWVSAAELAHVTFPPANHVFTRAIVDRLTAPPGRSD